MRLGDVANWDASEEAGKQVRTIQADAEPWRAAERMHEEAVGSLVVVDGEGCAVGMLTDRDLALRIVAVGGLREGARIADVMSAPLFALSPEDDVDRAVRLMRSKGLRRVPLVLEGRPVGLVALDDLLAALSRELLLLGEEALSARKHALREARSRGPLHELQELARLAHERLGRTKYMAQEAFMDEVDSLRERLRRALERL